MSTYINEIDWGVISVNEIDPINVTFKDIPASPDSNVIVSCKRFDLAVSTDTGTDVSSLAAISTNIVSLSKLWLGSDTPAAGRYRVQIVIRNAASTYKDEANLIIQVEMQESAKAIVLLVDVRRRFGFTDNLKDLLIQDWINTFSDEIEKYTRRKFKIQTVTDAIYNGSGSSCLTARWSPIYAFPSDEVSQKDRTDDVFYRDDPNSAWTKIETDADLIYFNEEEPWYVELYEEAFPFGRQNVKLSLKYGYTEIPGDIQKVIYRMIQNEWNLSKQGPGWLGKTSLSESAGATVSTGIQDLDEKFVAILERYRRISTL